MLAAIVLAQGQTTRFSHVGMVLHDGDRITVVHATPPEAGLRGGVVQEPLAAFASAEAAADVALYRVEGLDDAALQRLRTYLLAQFLRLTAFDHPAACVQWSMPRGRTFSSPAWASRPQRPETPGATAE